MLTHPQPAVYKCVTLVQRPLAASSTVYHSLFSGEGTQEIIYPAWPDIDDPDNPCCLPFLMRAMYFLDFGIAVTLEEVIAIAEEYVSRPEMMAVLAPEVHQQILALINTFQPLVKHSVQRKALSPGGEYVKKGQPSSVARNAIIEFTRSFTSNHTAQVIMPGVRGLLYGFLGNFPGTMHGDFSYAFSYCHEMGHRIARFMHNGIVQDGLSERIHKILYTLATKRLSRKRIAELWAEFSETNTYTIHLAKKFELIEEIFATYVGICALPAEVRSAVQPMVDASLREKGWEEANKAFVEACAHYPNSQSLPPFFVFETVCRMLEQVDIEGAKLLDAFVKIRKVVSPYIEILKQDNGSTLDDLVLEALAGRQAAEEVNQILEQVSIPEEVYYSSIDMENNIFRRMILSINDKTLYNNEEQLGILCAPDIQLEGKPSLKEIRPFIYYKGFQKKDKGELSPSARTFYESLRQQVSKPCGFVCPFAYEGEKCCGKKNVLLRLYERLPEEYKSNYKEPNCDLIL